MPELPEVETIVREMKEAGLINLRIERVVVFWNRSIAHISVNDFVQRLSQQTILGIARRGKYLVLALTNETLLIHLRMTGKFFIDKENSPPRSHERVRLYLSDGRILRYEDQRKFGKWDLVDAIEKLQKIGLEPLSSGFTLTAFKDLLSKRRSKIKFFLLDQHFVAGLGNIYVDEALWVAKIHPARIIETLSEKEILALHQAIISVLKSGVKNAGTSLGGARANYVTISGRQGRNQETLNVFRRNGLACPRCQTVIHKIFLAQRGTHYCPHCQK